VPYVAAIASEYTCDEHELNRRLRRLYHADLTSAQTPPTGRADLADATDPRQRRIHALSTTIDRLIDDRMAAAAPSSQALAIDACARRTPVPARARHGMDQPEPETSQPAFKVAYGGAAEDPSRVAREREARDAVPSKQMAPSPVACRLLGYHAKELAALDECRRTRAPVDVRSASAGRGGGWGGSARLIGSTGKRYAACFMVGASTCIEPAIVA
jgi:hypothetical protein